MSVPVFPSQLVSNITFPRPYTVEWPTAKLDALSGKRTRVSLVTYPIRHWDIPIQVLRTATAEQEWQDLIGFINEINGPAQLFAYDDPNDDSVTNQGFGTGDGVTTAFQLVRALGGFAEPVFLVNGTPTIKVSGSPVSPASISAYGVVNFSSAPAAAAPLTWTGSFYWPVRLDSETTDLEQIVMGIYSMKSLKFSSEKLP